MAFAQYTLKAGLNTVYAEKQTSAEKVIAVISKHDGGKVGSQVCPIGSWIVYLPSNEVVIMTDAEFTTKYS